MRRNRLLEYLRAGRIPVGHMIMEFGTRGIARLLAAAAPDFVVVDMEHSGFAIERVCDLMAWLRATDITPVVRVPQDHYHFIARVLDAGALGVMVGNVRSAEQARGIVRSAKYAPLGERGVGLGTAHTDYLLPDAASYFAWANDNTAVICQIESPEGVENAEAIAAAEGVDVLWVGHWDLSHSLGIPGEFQHPRFLGALERVAAAARRHGRGAGAQPGSPAQVEAWRKLGFNVLSWKSDIALYRDALRQELAALRERVGGEA